MVKIRKRLRKMGHDFKYSPAKCLSFRNSRPWLSFLRIYHYGDLVVPLKSIDRREVRIPRGEKFGSTNGQLKRQGDLTVLGAC